MVKTKKFIYVKPFVGEPTASNFNLVEEEIGEPKDGEVLCEAVYLSVDPYMRPYMARFPVGTTMIGGQVARVIKSKNPKFPEGSHVCGYFGWRTHMIFNPDAYPEGEAFGMPYILPSFGKHPYSLGVGCLGMPGNTAYFGFLEICQPKEGEVVVISTAAGAVGSLVGQIAKIKGCKVIGFSGSDEKCDWVKNELGFNYCFNYKTVNADEVLKKAAPNGVDCYFDNVGGELSSTIIHHMRDFGRISVCGSITAYNLNPTDMPKVGILQPDFIFKQLKMEGFIVNRWRKRFPEGIAQMLKWIDEGKIKYRETVTEGFENMPQAFFDILKGKNIGKAIVKA